MAEKITKDEVLPAEAEKKATDPKKVDAGNKLAQRNKEARKKELEEKPYDWSSVVDGLQVAAGAVSAGFVFYHGYRFFNPPKGGGKVRI